MYQDRFIARVAVVDSVEVRATRPGTSLKRLKLSVSIRGSSYSHLCRYFKYSKKMDIAI